MFGTLRFILALLVVGCHTDWFAVSAEVTAARELDLGGMAVVLFFILSGFVMTATVRRYYADKKEYGMFLVDRACRIFPQYLFWVAATILWIHFLDREAQPIGIQPVLENVSLLPLMFNVLDLRPWISGVAYLGQTWSLSLEWYFYMLLPVLLWSAKLRQWAFAVSFVIFTLATLNVITPNIYSYHLLPGVLFIFLLGSMAYDELAAKEPAGTRLIRPYLLVVLLAIFGNSLRTLHHHWTPEVLIGIFAGVPMIAWLARQKSHPLDDWLGNLSYGIFLNHYFVLGAIDKYKWVSGRWPVFFFTASAAILLAIPSYYLVEKPFVKLRRALRKRLQPAPATGR